MGIRIAYVLTSLGMGGAERQAVALAERMVERGHTVTLLVLMPRQSEQWPTALDAVHLKLRKNPLSVVAGFERGRRFLSDFHPDLVHSHCFHANIVARLLKLFHPQAAVLSTVHNVYEGSWPRMLAYRLTDSLSRHTTTVCQAAAEVYLRQKAISPGKYSVILNGIDVAELAPSAGRRSRMRAEMGAGSNFIWFTAGRISAAKDYPNLLRAFARLQAESPDAQLWIAGVAAGQSADAIQSLARELLPGESVRWLGLRRDLPALLDAADGFVLASAWEGMPLAVGEAMAMEKPVVATDAGGVRELVGAAGVIVPCRNAEALAEAMRTMMRTTAFERQALGQAARARIQAGFSMDAKADEWEALYRRLLETPV